MKRKNPINQNRRILLQGATCIGAASFGPAVFGNNLPNFSESALTGKLICKSFDPVKTLILHNHSDKTVVINKLSHGAFMFDGSIVDCNSACLSTPIMILPNQEIQVQFDRREQAALTHRTPVEFQRMQSRVMRLSDGTRVIPFDAKLHGDIATIL